MPTLNIGGKRVTVGDSFLNLSPEEQQSTVDEIASSLGGGEKSISGFATNALNNAGDIANSVINQFSNDPVGSLKAIPKTVIGMAQELVPGQQQYETQYADPFYKKVGRDFGFSKDQSGIHFSPGQLAENAYNRPVDIGLDVAGFTAPLESLPGKAGAVFRSINSVNPVSAAGRAVTSVARRAVTPFPARVDAAKAADALKAEGVDVTAGQATGNKALKYTESELGGGATSDMLDRQGEQFTRAASRRIGENADRLDPQTLNNAYKRIGGEFNTIGLRNRIAPNPQLAIDTQRAVQEYQYTTPASSQVPAVAGFGAVLTRAAQKGLQGGQYVTYRSRLSRLARGTKDPQLKAAYGDLTEALDDAAQASMSPADVKAFQTARQQYRNYKVLENAMATGGPATAAGILTPAKLEAAASSGPNRSWYARGLSDFTSLAKAGKGGMTPMPESGTAARAAVHFGPAVVGGLLTAGAAGLPEAAGAALAGAALPTAVGRVIMSRPGQAFLGNQLLPGETMAGRAVGRLGRIGAASTRAQDLDHAKMVLSENVLNHVKTSPTLRPLLNGWLKARHAGKGADEAGKALADAVAQDVKRPELAQRIFEELSAARGPQ